MAQTYSLGEAILATRADLSGLQAGLAQVDGVVRSQMESAGQSGLSFFQTVFATGLGGIVTQAISGVTSMITGLGSQLGGLAMSGLQFNSSMEIVTAQLNAFTKDGAVTADILEMIKTRAAATPFAFGDMAQAATALMPAAKQSGVALEELIQKAEILGASNPAEGLAGAAFALKEALGGDFVSIVERFNLPRQYLNELKEQGVPALEAVQMAMKQMGLDADLVSNLALTASGRWSTFQDTVTGFAATATQPIFQTFSDGMGQLNDAIAANQPLIDSFAAAIADTLAGAISYLTQNVLPPVIDAFGAFMGGFTDGGLTGGIQAFFESLSSISPVFGLIGDGIAGLSTMITVLGDIFGGIAAAASGWGENIVGQLGAGMWSAAQIVIDILNQIGAMIVNLLVPGSPPKLLPGLTDYGRGAIAAYMAGWDDKSSFTVFNNIASGIQGAIESIAKVTGDNAKLNIADVMLGEQGHIAAAITEVRELGGVTDETFQKIIDGAGPAGPAVSGMVRAYLELEAATQATQQAQEELNRVTDEYSARLDPLKGQLDSIRDQKQAIKDQERMQELQETLADSQATDAEKQLARLEMQEIATRQQIAAVEAERDTAVDAAKSKLEAAKAQEEAAKAQADQQKALLDVNNKQNDLIAQQVQALEAASKSIGGAAAAAKAGVPAQQQLADTMSTVGETVGKVGQVFDDVSGAAQAVSGTVRATVGPAFQVTQTIVGNVMAFISGIVATHGESVASTITEHFSTVRTVITTVLNAVSGVVSSVLAVVFRFWEQNGASIVSTVVSTWNTVMDTVDSVLRIVASVVGNLLGQVQTFIQNHGDEIVAVLSMAWNAISSIVSDALAIIQRVVLPGLAAIGSFIMAHGQDIQTILSGAWQAVSSAIVGVLSFIQGTVRAVMLAVNGDWAGAWQSFAGACAAVVQGIIGVVAGFLNMIAGLMGTSLAEIGAVWSGNWNTLLTLLSTVWSGMVSAVQGSVGAVVGAVVQLAADIYSAVTSLPGQMVDIGVQLVSGIREGINSQWEAFMAWIRDKVNQLPQPVRDALGISSPSRIFADIGEQLIEGLLDGISRMMPNVKVELIEGFAAAIGDMIDAIAQAFNVLKDLHGWVPPNVQDILDLLDLVTYLLANFVVAARQANWRDSLRELVDLFADAMAQLFDAITSVVLASKEMKDQTLISQDQLDIVFTNMTRIFETFATLADEWNGWSLYASADVLAAGATMLDAIKGGADAFASMQDLSVVSVASITIFIANLRLIITRFVELTANWTAEAVVAAAEFATQAGVMVGVIGSAVENFASLKDFAGVGQREIDLFRLAILNVLTSFALLVYRFTEEWLASAVLFADSTLKIVSILGDAIENLSALGGFEGITGASMDRFINAIYIVIRGFEWMMPWFAAVSLDKAAEFTASVMRFIGMIGEAVENLTLLGEFEGFTRTTMDLFNNALYTVIMGMDWARRWFSTTVLEAAAVFAQSAGQVVTIVGDAAEGFIALQDFEPLTQAALTGFVNAVGVIVRGIVGVAGTIAAAGLEHAELFAGAAGEVVNIIADGVGGFAALGAFVAPTQTSINDFSSAVKAVTQAMAVMASQFTAEAIAAATGFAEAVGTVLDVLKGGVEGLLALSTFSGQVPQQAMDDFAASVRRLILALAGVAATLSTTAIDGATLFASAANKVIDMLKDSAENMSDLTKMPLVTQAMVDTFMGNLQLLVDRILVMTTLIDQVTLARALNFAELAGKVVGAVKTGVKAFTDLGKWDEGTDQTPAETVTIFIRFQMAFNGVVAQIFAWLPPQVEPVGAQMLAGMARGITAGTGALVNALVAAVQAAIAAAKNALGIASPSALVALEIGEPIGEGIMAGIQAKASLIGATAAATASQAISTVHQTINNYDLNATYRFQDERSLRDDVQMLQMLKARPI